MSNRYIPYGYGIRNGEMTVLASEADTVRRIYAMRGNGYSLRDIMECLNSEGIPYSTTGGWNKNNVARLLRNTNYLGTNRFPCIIEREVMNAATLQNDRIVSRYTEHYTRAEEVLWDKLFCGKCGKPIWRSGGRAAANGKLLLKCSGDCGVSITTTTSDIMESLLSNMVGLMNTVNAAPQPDTEIVRLQRNVDRILERPDNPESVKKAIFELALSKYEKRRVPRLPIKYTDNPNRPCEIDWMSFARAVSHISIDEHHNMDIKYTGGENHDRNQHSSTTCDCDTGNS